METQLCVWQGTTLGEDTAENFVAFMKKEFDVRIKFDSVQITRPDRDRSGDRIPETGGRSDIFFYVHSGDVMKFAIPRLTAGIRWWEDVLAGGGAYLYAPQFLKSHPKTW